jgi:hypothetical protein
MDRTILVKEDIQAGQQFLNLFSSLWPYRIAFWLCSSEDSLNNLCVAFDEIEVVSRREWISRLLDVLHNHPEIELDTARVRAMDSQHPFALQAQETSARFPRSVGKHLGQSLFGGKVVDDVYIYPAPVLAVGS